MLTIASPESANKLGHDKSPDNNSVSQLNTGQPKHEKRDCNNTDPVEPSSVNAIVIEDYLNGKSIT